MQLGLLGRANAGAVRVLQRTAREVPQAHTLKVATPEPTLSEKVRQLRGSLTQVAACLAIALLGKIGLFSSIQNAQTHSQKALNQYYASQVGQELADEVFPG